MSFIKIYSVARASSRNRADRRTGKIAVSGLLRVASIFVLILSLSLAACSPAATPTQAANPIVTQPTAQSTSVAPAASPVPSTPDPTVTGSQSENQNTSTPDPSAGTGTTAETGSPVKCPPASPKMTITSTDLNVFAWPQYIPERVMECFQEVYGVNVNLDSFSSQEEMSSKLMQGVSGYDVVQPADNMLQLLVKQGLLEKLDHGKLTVLGNFSPEFLNPPFDPGNVYSLPYQLGSSGIAYNSDTVKTVPGSYADMWNPVYKGKLVMLDDSRNIIGMTLLSLGYDVNSVDPAQLAQAQAKLLVLLEGVRLFDSDSPKTVLLSGDADLGVIWATEASAAQFENASIQYVYPKEGVILWEDNFSILAGAAHKDLAYAWLNYLYQPDVFWMVMRDYPGTNPESAAIAYAKANEPDVYAAYMASNITNVPADVIKKGHWLQPLGENTPLYDQIWVEVKAR